MKHTSACTSLLGVLFLAFAPCASAQEDTPALPHIDDLQEKALQYLKDKRPDLKPENLVFSSVDYSYQPQGTTRKVFDPQGNEHWIPDSSFTQSLRVTFVDRSTRTEGVEAGQKVAVSQLFSVEFDRSLTACISVGNGTSTEHLH